MRRRIASNTALNWTSYLFERIELLREVLVEDDLVTPLRRHDLG